MTTAMNEERAYDQAYGLAENDLESLLAWALLNVQEAAALVDETIATLGIPTPDIGADGENVAGSVLRQLLHHAHAEWNYRLLTTAFVA